MALTITYFYSLTPRQFFNIQKGWSDRRDAESKERMILTRRLMYAALSPYSKNLTEQSMWPFDWENQTQQARTEAEDLQMQTDLQASIKRWEKRDAILNKKKAPN